MEKTCTKCGKTKPVGEFHRRGDGAGYRSKCKLCYRERLLVYYKDHKTEYRQADARFRKAHPERQRQKMRVKRHRQRAILRGLTEHHSKQDRDSVLAKYGNRCLHCRAMPPEVRIVLDHVVPLARGGTNTVDNLQPLCEECNTKKGPTTADFRPRRVPINSL